MTFFSEYGKIDMLNRGADEQKYRAQCERQISAREKGYLRRSELPLPEVLLGVRVNTLATVTDVENYFCTRCTLRSFVCAKILHGKNFISNISAAVYR